MISEPGAYLRFDCTGGDGKKGWFFDVFLRGIYGLFDEVKKTLQRVWGR